MSLAEIALNSCPGLCDDQVISDTVYIRCYLYYISVLIFLRAAVGGVWCHIKHITWLAGWLTGLVSQWII